MLRIEIELKKWILKNTLRRPPLWAYICSLLLCLALFLLSRKLEGETEALFSIFYLFLPIFGALALGPGPALLMALLASLSIDYHYVTPRHETLVSLDGGLIFFTVFVFTLVLLFVTRLLRLATNEAVRAQSVAESAVQMQEETFAAVAHDMRQPLTAVRLRLQHATHCLEKDTPEKIVPRLRQAIVTLQRIDDLIEDILDLGKPDRNIFSRRREPTDLLGLAEETIESLRPIAQQKGIALNLKSSAAPRAPVDRRRIGRVMANLLGNALKFTPSGGRVEMEITTVENTLALMRVSDSGPGVPADKLGHLFVKNWQAEDTAHLGHGLGLYIADQIIRAHGGLIWYESNPSPSFYFTIPTRDISASLPPKMWSSTETLTNKNYL